jgi:hypothetical protein
MPYVLTCAAEALGTSRNEKVIEPLIKLLENNTNSDVLSSAAVALGEIGPPAKFGLSYIDRLYEKERDYKKKYFLIRAMLKIDPTNRKYLTTMIEEILPHPFAALGNYYYCLVKSPLSHLLSKIFIFKIFCFLKCIILWYN